MIGLTQLAQAIAKLKYICIIQVMQLAQIGSGRSPVTQQFKFAVREKKGISPQAYPQKIN